MSQLKTIFSIMSLSFLLTGCGGAASDEITGNRSIVDQLEEVTGNGQNSQQGDASDSTNDNSDEVVSNDDQNTSEEDAPPYTQDTMSASVTLQPAGFYEDGTVMGQDEISHYKIVYGTDAEHLDKSYELAMSGLLSFNFEAAINQTWYVAVKTVSIYGGESAPSNIIAFNF